LAYSARVNRRSTGIGIDATPADASLGACAPVSALRADEPSNSEPAVKAALQIVIHLIDIPESPPRQMDSD
jgi:hypothetical protein